MIDDRNSYITVIRVRNGWAAGFMVFDDNLDAFLIHVKSSAFPNEEEAAEYGRIWAAEEEVPFIEREK